MVEEILTIQLHPDMGLSIESKDNSYLSLQAVRLRKFTDTLASADSYTTWHSQGQIDEIMRHLYFMP